MPWDLPEQIELPLGWVIDHWWLWLVVYFVLIIGYFARALYVQRKYGREQ